MIDELRKLFKNKKTETACQKVLGTKTNVAEFARFWDKNEEVIGILGAWCLLEYVTNQNPSPEELIAYKHGLADALLFPGRCSAEMKAVDRLASGQ
jgi:hypothetical protein